MNPLILPWSAELPDRCVRLTFAIAGILLCSAGAPAQPFLPSPLQWLFPRGIPEATSTQLTPSAPQALDSFRIKWREPTLAGEGAVLVGSVRPSGKLVASLPWAPNNIVAVRGDTLFLLDGSGWIRGRALLPPFSWDVSALLDTLTPVPRAYSANPVIIALESVEHRSPDSLATSFLLGMAAADTLTVLRRLTVDMRPYAPNLAAALVPVAARSAGGRTLSYALLHAVRPDTSAVYARGITSFASDSLLPAFPIASTPDDTAARLLYAPRLWHTQPSLTLLPGGILRLLLPLHPSSAEHTLLLNRLGQRTRADSAYLIGIDLQGNIPSSGIAPVPLPLEPGSEPIVLPLWVRLQPTATGSERWYILVAVGFRGNASSSSATLHLYDATGQPLASTGIPGSPPFLGATSHFWSIAVGDVDAPTSNAVPPFYPNNPGAEILATPNTPEHAVPNARLFVLRYRTDLRVPKPQPPNAFLFPFDTIVSAPCSGWLAATADLDGDGKEEILLADQGTLQVWRLRPYADPLFALGAPFDTVLSLTFPGERITSVVVADVEGDGRADILVRTTGALYCVGTPVLPAWTLLSPSRDTALCVGDTLVLRWVNHVRGFSPVTLSFQPYTGGRPDGTPRLLATLSNDRDTVSFALPVRRFLPDTAGRLLLQCSTPASMQDSTGLLSIRFPMLTLSAPRADDTVTVGDTVLFQGQCSCADVLRVLPGDGATEMQTGIDSSGAITLRLVVPCPPGVSCWKTLPPWRPTLLAEADSFVFRLPLLLHRRAQPLSASLALFPTSICPEVLLQTPLPCPELMLGVSSDGGQTFTEVPPSLPGENTRWVLPSIAGDTLWLRLCCRCQRLDTSIFLTSPLQLELLAPNPVHFPEEELQIRYSLREPSSVRVRILDVADNLIRELVPWRYHASGVVYCERWDGTAHSGARVPSGTYYVLIEQEQKRWLLPVFVRWKSP